MAQKRKLWLTKARITLLVAIIKCLEKSPNGEGYQIRKVFPVLKKYYETKGERLTGSMIQLMIDTLVKEGVFRIADRSTLSGDKAPSILYVFNPEIFESCEIFEVVRNNAEGRKAGRKAIIEGPEITASAGAADAPSASMTIPTAQPGDDPIADAIQKIVVKMNAAEDRVRVALAHIGEAERERDDAQEEAKKCADLLRNYQRAQEQLLEAAEKAE